MLVVLRDNVENLGRTGDVVKVSDGYARNFLLPRNLVVAADESNLASIEHHKRSLEKKRQEQMVSAKEVAGKLEAFSCNISRKVGEQDKLFGSVTTSDIADALKKGGFQIDKRTIVLDAPIKTLGAHSVTIKFDHDVTANLKVNVVKE